MESTSNKGTNLRLNDDNAWFVVEEAECVDSLDTFDDLFENSTECSNISNLIDDNLDETDQGNSLALFNHQITEECNIAIAALKRKYTSSPPQPSVAALSPRLEAIRISPQKAHSSKRRLFRDSGIGEDETTHSDVQVETENSPVSNGETVKSAIQEIFLAKNKNAKLLYKCQELFGIAYSDITRCFKSDKSLCENWVVFVFAAACEVIEGSKVILQKHCEYVQCMQFDFSALYLLHFKTAKNRTTVNKLFCNILNIQECQLLCNPPNSKSVPCALYFYKQCITEKAFTFGKLPKWVSKQTQVNHQLACQAEAFELSKMVQWAYDNRITEEPEIAYEYALLAETDGNAAAFLKSNQQVRYVRDCQSMVKLYLKQEMRNMSMSQWIFKCCNECEGEEDWKVICNFLKFQHVNIISFLTALRYLFKAVPKRNCIVIHGPPDTGKSYFCFSLVRFLKGKVVSYFNKSSQFWLQPMLESKIGFLDDATVCCWNYIDNYMRNALDGNPMCIDAKHKAPQQVKLPPFLITTNLNVMIMDDFKYLHSRLTCFEFPNKVPLDQWGTPIYKFTDQAWKCFFLKLAKQLDLQEDENESERPGRAFRCTTDAVDDPL
uniref:Replication protein E1 n=1 Tax=Human papillomavirus TaxID=10566 RepID=A0A385PKC0_9PAPI|nr:MAG: E1 protein [Human papillomavirus]